MRARLHRVPSSRKAATDCSPGREPPEKYRPYSVKPRSGYIFIAWGVSPPKKEQAAIDEALKARHSYSLGREPQDSGQQEVKEPRSGDTLSNGRIGTRHVDSDSVSDSDIDHTSAAR